MTDHVVLVCGGRNYASRATVYECLDGLLPPPTLIITGGANGADALAIDWCAFRQIPKLVFHADWEKYGRAAGPIRNQQMLECTPDLVMAFPGGKGTADMVRRARAAGIRVFDVQKELLNGC